MGSINIDFLSRNDTTKSSALYSDLQLDLTNDYKVRGNFTKDSTQVIDIKIAYDLDAIANSLTNLFRTLPGQRLLLPEYGLNIQQFLFSPITTSSAHSIGELMSEAIDKWEPRIEITNLSIRPQPSDGVYEISLSFFVRSLKLNSTFSGNVVQGDGFIRG